MTLKKNSSIDVREWLGILQPLDYSNSKTLGRVLGILLTASAFLLVILTLIIVTDFFLASLRAGPYEDDTDGSAIRNIGLVLVGMLGAPFVVWRTFVASKQVSIADEALFNEKMESAQKGLTARHEFSHIDSEQGIPVANQWVDDLVTRAAALDRLEGLVAERPEAAPRVVKIIAAYVRGSFPAQNLTPSEPPFDVKTPRLDLQRAIDVIGRVHRVAVATDSSHWRLDLRGCNLDGVNFEGGYFWAADFTGCRIEASLLSEATFEGCLFKNTLLNYSTFIRTNLVGVRFDGATINRPTSMPLVPHSIAIGDLTGATFIAADISALAYLGAPEQISKTFGTQNTQVSQVLRDKMPDEGKHGKVITRRLARAYNTPTEAEIAEDAEVNATGFQNWSPWASYDGATGALLEKFYEQLDMKRWPYW